MIDTLSTSISPDKLMSFSQKMLKENYLASAEAAPSMQELFTHLNTDILKSRGLRKFIEVGPDMLRRIICLPTTTLMAIRHLGGDKALTLSDFYELGVYVHVNDRQSDNGNIEKGFPSFHKDSMDTYLRYALEFAKIAGLEGGIITNFKDTRFIDPVIENGGAVILSVDNLFIPYVMNTALDPATFKPSRHAELIHGRWEDNLVLSDVTNVRDGLSWDTVNKVVTRESLDSNLTCPRLNDNLTRAIVLTKNSTEWGRISDKLHKFGNVEEPRHNPILIPFFGQGIVSALKTTRNAANKGSAQWDMVK
jgi:hypothetical protein